MNRRIKEIKGVRAYRVGGLGDEGIGDKGIIMIEGIRDDGIRG